MNDGSDLNSVTRWQREAIRFTAAVFIFLGCYSCAPQPVTAPSGVGVTSGIGRTSTSVSSAQKYNDVAVVHNANAMTRVQRIEAKAAVVEKYWTK